MFKKNLFASLSALTISTGALLLLFVNRSIWLVGLSTLLDDYPNAPEGLINLIATIAAWDWRILLVLALSGVAWQGYVSIAAVKEIKKASDSVVEFHQLLGELRAVNERLDDLDRNISYNLEKNRASLAESFRTYAHLSNSIEDILALEAISGRVEGELLTLSENKNFSVVEADMDEFIGSYDALSGTLRRIIPDIGMGPMSHDMLHKEAMAQAIKYNSTDNTAKIAEYLSSKKYLEIYKRQIAGLPMPVFERTKGEELFLPLNEGTESEKPR